MFESKQPDGFAFEIGMVKSDCSIVKVIGFWIDSRRLALALNNIPISSILKVFLYF